MVPLVVPLVVLRLKPPAPLLDEELLLEVGLEVKPPPAPALNPVAEDPKLPPRLSEKVAATLVVPPPVFDATLEALEIELPVLALFMLEVVISRLPLLPALVSTAPPFILPVVIRRAPLLPAPVSVEPTLPTPMAGVLVPAPGVLGLPEEAELEEKANGAVVVVVVVVWVVVTGTCVTTGVV
ncbi:MAG: hypothetical protein WCJ64_07590, partial [Rhodospirillaceae bacterium]